MHGCAGWRAWPCGTEVGVDRVEHAQARLRDEVAVSKGTHGPEVPAQLPAAARQQQRDHVVLLGIFRSALLNAPNEALLHADFTREALSRRSR